MYICVLFVVGGPCGTVGHYGGQQLECVLEGLCQGQNRVSTYANVKKCKLLCEDQYRVS